MTVDIHIVTYNSEKDIANCLRSVFYQTHKPHRIRVLDNASADQTTTLLESYRDRVTIILNPHNTGFSAAHNKLIDQSSADAILVLNPDMVLDPDYIRHLVALFEREPQCAIASGKLLRLDPVSRRPTSIIDSTGMFLSRSLNGFDRGAGECDTNSYNQTERVFGVSGAACLIRRLALADIKQDGDYFDEDFFLYKEDVDLSWRCWLWGFAAWYEPASRGYHARTLLGDATPGIRGHLRSIQQRSKRNKKSNIHSFENYHYTIIKNVFFADFLLSSPFILWRELQSIALVLFFEPYLFTSYIHILRSFPRMYSKRKQALKNTNRHSGEIRTWMV